MASAVRCPSVELRSVLITGAFALCRLRIQSTPTASSPMFARARASPADPAQNSIAFGWHSCCGAEGIDKERLTQPVDKFSDGRCAPEGVLLVGDSNKTIGSARTGGPSTAGLATAAGFSRGALDRWCLNDSNRACFRQGVSLSHTHPVANARSQGSDMRGTEPQERRMRRPARGPRPGPRPAWRVRHLSDGAGRTRIRTPPCRCSPGDNTNETRAGTSDPALHHGIPP